MCVMGITKPTHWVCPKAHTQVVCSTYLKVFGHRPYLVLKHTNQGIFKAPYCVEINT
jgi:hypothetical protein